MWASYGLGAGQGGLAMASLATASAAWCQDPDAQADTTRVMMLFGSAVLARYHGSYYAKARNLRRSLRAAYEAAFARALGEYGSVVFVSGNKQFETEIAPVLIVAKLEEYAYAEATAIATVLLVFSFVTLVVINLAQRWSRKNET